MSRMIFVYFPVLELEMPDFVAVNWVLRDTDEMLEGRTVREVCEDWGDEVFFSGLGPDSRGETKGF